MSYRYWVIALAFGFIFLAANPERNRAQERNEAQAEQIKIPWPQFGPLKQADNSDELTEPCQAERDNRKSDLCAQWKAADAAKKSADWSVYLGIAGALIGIFTLAAALAAAKFAKDAVSETRRIGEAQVRAYLCVTAINFVGGAPRSVFVGVIASISNSGNSPAQNVSVEYELIPADDKRKSLADVRFSISKITHLPAGQNTETLVSATNFKTDYDGDEIMVARINATVTWLDIFKISQTEKFYFIVVIKRTANGVASECKVIADTH